ncbi:hypothetical protein LG634_02780 [Streptomyces bambusae]|uniref:hypothetical protein n=1 Tax=Streptomyces bambusae TaxID=1550616 RepID=UPI001CFEB614|nr:hypothetical protein [Streptomyces bambusae]MCB5163769.1 hypothetical protein [Streptomyces bambusae]
MSRTRSRPPAARPVTLWRDVLIAYLAPALTAGLGGVLGGRPGLTAAAVTSIAGTSALVTAIVGGWLKSRSRRMPPNLPRPLFAAGLALLAAALAAPAGWLAAGWLPEYVGLPDPDWPDRLRTDLPLSAAIAAAVTGWRRHGTARQPEHTTAREAASS